MAPVLRCDGCCVGGVLALYAIYIHVCKLRLQIWLESLVYGSMTGFSSPSFHLLAVAPRRLKHAAYRRYVFLGHGLASLLQFWILLQLRRLVKRPMRVW
jgi:hypothetical protein